MAALWGLSVQLRVVIARPQIQYQLRLIRAYARLVTQMVSVCTAIWHHTMSSAELTQEATVILMLTNVVVGHAMEQTTRVRIHHRTITFLVTHIDAHVAMASQTAGADIPIS